MFDHPGLFIVPVNRSRAMSAPAKPIELPAVPPGPARVMPTDPRTGGLHRYCSGCAHDTEHVGASGGHGSMPSIRSADKRTGGGHDYLLDLWPVACSQLPTEPSGVVELAQEPDRFAKPGRRCWLGRHHRRCGFRNSSGERGNAAEARAAPSAEKHPHAPRPQSLDSCLTARWTLSSTAALPAELLEFGRFAVDDSRLSRPDRSDQPFTRAPGLARPIRAGAGNGRHHVGATLLVAAP
jgi:hypothetical protein